MSKLIRTEYIDSIGAKVEHKDVPTGRYQVVTFPTNYPKPVPSAIAQNQKRIDTERAIVKHAIDALLKYGYALSVHDGEEIVLLNSLNADAIFAKMFTTDEDFLYAVGFDQTETGKRVNYNRKGYVRFVYGNGYDVINDWSTSLEDAISTTIEFAGTFEAAEAF
jgi:hypothetical protein